MSIHAEWKLLPQQVPLLRDLYGFVHGIRNGR